MIDSCKRVIDFYARNKYEKRKLIVKHEEVVNQYQKDPDREIINSLLPSTLRKTQGCVKGL